MGSGEFDGGSSVTWRINHSDGDSGNGNQHGAHGKDKHPKGPNGMFVVEFGSPPDLRAHERHHRSRRVGRLGSECASCGHRGKDREVEDQEGERLTRQEPRNSFLSRALSPLACGAPIPSSAIVSSFAVG